ncbi:NDP-hexose 2,3-dehydratase [Nocardiopsis dassonvillei subsp. albirubida]|uniref:NDP-hexose 2,3-dehydratase n=1 Tax=Nocardiopsis alborubida TaxID=146802 RepID=A0A7X6RSV3_9ACTN|nr:NDP-hexose 2,3-dehydratase [Nocardiopsis alborubida]
MFHAPATARLTRSAVADLRPSGLEGFHQWWRERKDAAHFSVDPIPFAQLDEWEFSAETGNLGHTSGRFFSVEGVQPHGAESTRSGQPIICQPEIGTLGILVKEFDGVLHLLMQAKAEPGNVNGIQLSPTVQATRSNYRRVHRGGRTEYLRYFADAAEHVLVDSLQGEQGMWFWQKQNRNQVVETTGDVPALGNHRWLTLHELRKLMSVDDLVNMDSRTVLSCLPLAPPVDGPAASSDPFTLALARSYRSLDPASAFPAQHGEGELLSWLIDQRVHSSLRPRLVPMRNLRDWSRTDWEIADAGGKDFRIIAVRVEGGGREVAAWTQPLLAPRAPGLAVFLVARIRGVLHVLAQAGEEPGAREIAHIVPTVHVPAGAEAGEPAHLLEAALTEDPDRVRFDTVLSEEGGRFHHARTRTRVVEVDAGITGEPAERFRWITVGQLVGLLHHGPHVSMEARSLISCLHSLW